MYSRIFSSYISPSLHITTDTKLATGVQWLLEITGFWTCLGGRWRIWTADFLLVREALWPSELIAQFISIQITTGTLTSCLSRTRSVGKLIAQFISIQITTGTLTSCLSRTRSVGKLIAQLIVIQIAKGTPTSCLSRTRGVGKLIAQTGTKLRSFILFRRCLF